MELSSKLPETTELAPTTQPLPILVPGKITTLSPTQTLLPIETGKLYNFLYFGISFGLEQSVPL